MGKRAFTLPEGLKLRVTDDRMDLEFDGDLEIETSLGRRIGTIVATGDLTMKLDVVNGDLRAGGVLKILGDVDAVNIHGREVVIGKQTIKARAISASEKITIGPSNLSVDVIIAPEIAIDPKAGGRVTVIESQNDRNPTKIKGGFSLADYEDMFGNSAEFLTQRGVAPIGQSPPPPTPAPAEPARPNLNDARSTPVTTQTRAPSAKPAPPRSTVPDVRPPAPATNRTAVPASEKKGKDDDEDTDDPLSLSLDDLEPLVEQSNKPSNDELHQRLTDALGRITACYEGTDLPPAVEELKELVEQRDYDALRQNITEVWNGLLGFHQKRGIRPHHQVTHAFNVIHGLVQG